MAFYWKLVDMEMRLPEDEYKDKSCSTEGMRDSPFSQASTAPCTPIRFFLPDPFDVPPPQPSFSFCVAQPLLSICLSPCWAEYKQAGKPDIKAKEVKEVAPPKPKKWKVQVSKPLLSICMSPWWTQYKQGWKDSIPPVLRSASIPPFLMSELAIWAQNVVLAKAHPMEHVPHSQAKAQPREHVPRSQQEFAVLEFVYKHEHPVKVNIKDYLPRNQQHFAVLEFVTKHEFKVENVVLVDNADWDILGPTRDRDQDLDDDDEDEWLQVDELYTPSDLEGMCVLTANPVSVGMSVRALTPDGRVIWLNGGGPVTFSCEAELSSGHVRKLAAISMVKTSSGACLAKAASDVDNETICSIDAAGTVRGGAAVDATAAQTKKDRLKLFHWKRKHQQLGTISSRATKHSQGLSVDASGHVFLFNVKRARRAARVQVSKTPRSATGVVRTIDVIGVVRDVMTMG